MTLLFPKAVEDPAILSTPGANGLSPMGAIGNNPGLNKVCAPNTIWCPGILAGVTVNVTANWRQFLQPVQGGSDPMAPEFSKAVEVLSKASADGEDEASLVLGHLYRQLTGLADAPRLCAQYYRRAADQGHPVAQDRLADLYMSGYGLEQDDIQAFYWTQQTANQAYAHALCNLAYMQREGIGVAPDDRAADASLLLAVALADARALFTLGLRYMTHAHVSAYASAAQACMQLAAYADYPMASSYLLKLEATMSYQSRRDGDLLTTRLRKQLRSFQERLETSPWLAHSPQQLTEFALENLRPLESSPLSVHGTARMNDVVGPYPLNRKTTLCTEPRIFCIDQFISEVEQAHLLALAAERMMSSDQATKDLLSSEQTAFTGRSAVFSSVDYDPVLRAVERRIANVFGHRPSQVELLSVICYRPQDAYAPHVDYFDEMRLASNQEAGDPAGQRVASFLVYLIAPLKGGETDYRAVGCKVMGKPRMALCHFNVDLHGAADPRTVHAGNRVEAGEKYLARTTLRERAFF